jgi:hypothetical protein
VITKSTQICTSIKKKPCPKLVPLTCAHGDGSGSCCGVEKRLAILKELSKLSTDDESDKVEVKCWKDVACSGTDKNGNQNTQCELTTEVWTIKKLVDEFVKQMEICIPHYQEIRWIRHIQNTDFSCLPRIGSSSLLILRQACVFERQRPRIRQLTLMW